MAATDWGREPESTSPVTPAAPSSTTAVAGMATSTNRRCRVERESRAKGDGRRAGSAAMARTRSRSAPSATGRAACSSVISSAGVIVPHLLLEFGQRPAEPGGYGSWADAEDARRLLAVELDHDPEREHLTLACAQRCERDLQDRRQPFDEVRFVRLRLGGRLLAPPAPRLGPEPVERRCASDSEQPGTRAGAAGVEAAPLAERLLERRAREIVRKRPVARQVEQVTEDVVEMSFGCLGERLVRGCAASSAG